MVFKSVQGCPMQDFMYVHQIVGASGRNNHIFSYLDFRPILPSASFRTASQRKYLIRPGMEEHVTWSCDSAGPITPQGTW